MWHRSGFPATINLLVISHHSHLLQINAMNLLNTFICGIFMQTNIKQLIYLSDIIYGQFHPLWIWPLYTQVIGLVSDDRVQDRITHIHTKTKGHDVIYSVWNWEDHPEQISNPSVCGWPLPWYGSTSAAPFDRCSWNRPSYFLVPFND